MSQLNNNDTDNVDDVENIDLSESSKGKKNKISYEKKLLIFVIVSICLMIGITTALIILSREKNSEKVVLENTTQNSEDLTVDLDIKRASLEDKYVINPIKINKKEEKIERGKKTDRIEYVEISGLKDKNVEINLNNNLKQKATDEYYTLKEKAIKKYDEKLLEKMDVYVTEVVTFNGASILSVNIYGDGTYYKTESSDPQMVSINKGMTYSLVDGSKIPFKDIFTKDAPITSIMEDTFYETYAWDYAFSDPEFDTDISKKDYGKIELDVYNDIVTLKENWDNISYSIYDRGISLFGFTKNDVEIIPNVSMKKYFKYINIYNLYGYKPELYENTNDTLSLYVLEEYYDADIDKEVEEDNFLLRYRITYDMEKEDYRDVIETCEKDLLKKVDEYKQKYIDDKHSLFISATGHIGDSNEEKDKITCFAEYGIYVVDNDIFKVELKEAYRETLQGDEPYELFLNYDDNLDKKIKSKYESYTYTYNKENYKLESVVNDNSEIDDDQQQEENIVSNTIISNEYYNEADTNNYNIVDTNDYNVYNESIVDTNDYNDYNDYNIYNVMSEDEKNIEN